MKPVKRDEIELRKAKLAAQRLNLSPAKQSLLEKRLRSAEQGPSEAPIPAIARGGQLPLSFAQQRLWFLDQLDPDNAAYNIPLAVRLAGKLNAAVLQQSLNEVVRRHEVLRTTFAIEDGRPTQIIAPTWVIALPMIDLQAMREAEQATRVQQLVLEEAGRPFDLEHGPLARAGLLRLNAHEHVLLLTLHHIVSDGWSMGVLVREMAALYQAFSNGQPSPLPDLPIQYADYAAWQRQWLTGEALEKQLGYWKRQLNGALSVLELPTDHPRPPVQTLRGATHTFVMSTALMEDLKMLSRQQDVTLFMTVLAAFQTLLLRYTGQTDLIVGAPIANRNRAETEDLIGFFVNTLALRVDLSGNPTFRELLQRVRQVTLEAYIHQDLPFDRLVEELHLTRDLSRTPLFQVMLALQNAPVASIESADLKLTALETESGTANFDLTLTLTETAKGLRGILEYNADLFEAATIARLSEHLQTLLEGIVAHADWPLSDLPLLTETEQRQLLEWNDVCQDDAKGRCLPELFEDQVEQTPDAVAVVFEYQHLTYRELNRRANQLAQYLRQLGVGPETFVGLCLERSPEMIVGLLGILKAGGAYVPLDPTSPTQRLAVILQETQVRLLISQAALASILSTIEAPVLLLDRDWAVIARAGSSNPARITQPPHLAYVIYTSGSTGKPKGVMLPHRALAQYVTAARRHFEVTPEDCVLQFASISFDAAAEEIYPCLLSGAKLVLRTDGMLDSIETFIQECAAQCLTVLDLPTAYWHTLLAQFEAGDLVFAPTLRLMILGGEAALAEKLAAWQAQAPAHIRLVNTYGPTESTIVATMCDLVRQPVADDTLKVPIGKPVANTQVYVLDRRWRPVPIGVPGELYIGGTNLARGYLKRPDLTAAVFIPDPFSEARGGRLYKTGDLARYRPDGNLEFIGRVDHQVKIRGYRIELGEIEAALVQHPAVREAVVVMHEEQIGNRRLVAYVVLSTVAFDIGDLRHYLHDKLPEYMLPSAFVVLEALPLTPNGKVDRRALPAPDSTRPELAQTLVAPRTPTEAALAAIWAQVLGLTQVGIFDNFFELGGHSLLATQIISRIRQVMQVELSVRALFEKPTIAGLAAYLEDKHQVEPAVSKVPIPLITRDGSLLLSFGQERLWFLDQLDPGSAAYNIPLAVRLAGKLNAAVLQQSWNEVVRRHEVLRTTFAIEEGRPTQIIAPTWVIALPVIDLQAMCEAEQATRVQQLALEEAGRPFDLEHGSLARAGLLRLNAHEHVLLLTLHHIVSDGWSLGVLVREMAALYQAFSSGQPSPLPDLPIQYADYAAWQRQWLTGEVLEKQLGYWKHQLGGALPVLELPTDHPRPPMQTLQGATQSFTIPLSLLEGLKALSRQQDATLFMTVLAAFQTLLWRYTGQTDLIVGAPIANRNRAETEGLIGFFVNTLALRVDLSGNPTFRELLQRVRQVTLEAYAHQDLPFDRLVEELHLTRDLSRTPLFQVMLVLQNAPMPSFESGDLKLTSLETESKTAKFDLTLSLTETNQGLLGALEYNTDLFDTVTMRNWLEHFQTLLESLVNQPSQRLSDLHVLTDRERQQLLVDWNATQFEYPLDQDLQTLFERQVEQVPEAVAGVWDDRHLTYAALNQRANQLAHYLRRLGVGPETLVGLCLERSLDLIIGLLAILKAGGAYVPLDPAYPKERLDFILADSQAIVVVTQTDLREYLPQTESQWVCLDSSGPILAQECDQNLPRITTAQNLAYVIYTSGSTGRPKGVAIQHNNAVAFLHWALRHFEAVQPYDVLAATSISFDLSVFEIFGTLSRGGTIVLAHNALHLPSLLAASRVQLVNTVPSAMKELLQSEGLPHALQVVNLAGEPLAQTVVEQLYQQGIQSVHDLYGPSETTTYSTHALRTSGGRSTIGRPIDNTQVYVLDAQWNPVPVGVPGELYIGGQGVTRGYLHRPDLTAERFRPDPFGPTPGGRLYQTGDLVRYRPDGNLEFIGRADHQVKIRGYRIELGEIETVLKQQPSVREGVVVAREDPSGGKRLVAYVVSTLAQPDPNEWRAGLRRQLPEYMLPAAFVVLEALPLTPNGKVDRRALPAPDSTRPELAQTLVAPRTPTEEALATIWAQVLGLTQVGIFDNFFELGGHSLLVTQIVSRIRIHFQIEVPLNRLFKSPTVASLAENIDALRWTAQNLLASNNPATDREEGEL